MEVKAPYECVIIIIIYFQNFQYGLYSGLMGCFVYLILGSCKDVNIGPTAIMALMIQPHVTALGPDIAVLACFLTGCVICLLGLLQLGNILKYNETFFHKSILTK